MTMPDLEYKVLQAISRIAHLPVEKLKGDLKLKEDLGLDSLNFMELEYELQQSGLPEIEMENMGSLATITEVVDFLRAKQ